MPIRLLAAVLVAVLIVAGCGPPERGPERICPGAESANKALFELRLRWESAVAVKATGHCRLKLHSPDKEHDEGFPVRVWVNPPNEICLQGDIAFNPKGIVLGANADKFWLVTRPKELRRYWWGRWDRQGGLNSQLAISPRLLLEAVGVVAVGPDADTSGRWSLSNEGAYDVLIRLNRAGEIVKKVYVYNCDRRVSRIEYFDADGRTAATTELDKYRDVAEGFAVPTEIVMVKYRTDGKADSAKITLRSVKPANLSDKARQKLFTLPPERGLEPVEIVDGKPLVEPQQEF